MMTDEEFEAALAAAKARGDLLRLAREARERGDYERATQAHLLWGQWEDDGDE